MYGKAQDCGNKPAKPPLDGSGGAGPYDRRPAKPHPSPGTPAEPGRRAEARVGRPAEATGLALRRVRVYVDGDCGLSIRVRRVMEGPDHLERLDFLNAREGAGAGPLPLR